MKTASLEKKCKNCDNYTSQMGRIKQAAQYLEMGHKGVAAVYKSIARELKDPEDVRAFNEMADKHLKMAEESLKVVELTEDDQPDTQKEVAK